MNCLEAVESVISWTGSVLLFTVSLYSHSSTGRAAAGSEQVARTLAQPSAQPWSPLQRTLPRTEGEWGEGPVVEQGDGGEESAAAPLGRGRGDAGPGRLLGLLVVVAGRALALLELLEDILGLGCDLVPVRGRGHVHKLLAPSGELVAQRHGAGRPHHLLRDPLDADVLVEAHMLGIGQARLLGVQGGRPLYLEIKKCGKHF